MKIGNILLLGLLLMCVSCGGVRPEEPSKIPPDNATTAPVIVRPEASQAAAPVTSPKIELDLSKLDENGMRGRGTGKVLAAYEFCIPNTAKCKAEVKAIAPGVRFMAGSRGRIGAGKDECLCIGETGPNYRSVLNGLAALPYVKRIIECHFE